MLPRVSRHAAILFALLVFALPSLARVQPAPGSVQELLTSPSGPKTVGDLDGSWKRMNIAYRAGGKLSEYLCYTQGRTVSANGATMIVAYTPVREPIYSALTGSGGSETEPSKPPSPVLAFMQPIEAGTRLSLRLLDMRNVEAIRDVAPYEANPAAATYISRLDMGEGATNLAILGAILFPVFARAREKASDTTSLSNLKQLALAALMNTQDNDEHFPSLRDAATIKKALLPYAKSNEIFVQPETGQPYRGNLAVSRKYLGAIDDIANTVLFYEATPRPDGSRLVAFTDGHVKRVSGDEWTRLSAGGRVR